MSEPDRTWTVLELLRWTTEHFASKGIDSARLDAECLLAHALGVQRLQLYIDFEKPVQPEERAAFRALVRRRGGERVPVAQLVGEKEFWSLTFRVGPEVLTPRPDTETLVAAALDRLEKDTTARVLDVGTGSGAIAVAIAHDRPGARVSASDISEAALQIAATNAETLLGEERVRLLAGDLFAPVEGEQFDLVVSNPPYVARRDAGKLPPELAHEPEQALFGGEDGLQTLRRFAAEVGEVMAPGAWVLVEIDPAQAPQVVEWFEAAGLVDGEILTDLARRARVVAARKA